MARLQMSAIVDGASGVVGGVEFRNTRAGVVAAARRSRSSMSCALPVRGLLYADRAPYSAGWPLQCFWGKWWAATPELRRRWDVYAGGVGCVDVFGVRRPGLGWRLCYSAFYAHMEAFGLKAVGFYVLSLPVPPAAGALSIGPLSVSIAAVSDPASFVVSCVSDPGQTRNGVLYLARFAGNRGVETVRGWRYCGAKDMAGGSSDYALLIADNGWALQAGEQVFAEVFMVYGTLQAGAVWSFVRSNRVFLKVLVA